MNKILIVGGTNGLGKHLTEHFNARGIGRSNGYTLPDAIDKVVTLSVDYNIIINCLPDVNQNTIIKALWRKHVESNKDTYFISIGSLSTKVEKYMTTKKELVDITDKFWLEETKCKHTLIAPANLEGVDLPFTPLKYNSVAKIINTLITLFNNDDYVLGTIEVVGKHVTDPNFKTTYGIEN